MCHPSDFYAAIRTIRKHTFFLNWVKLPINSILPLTKSNPGFPDGAVVKNPPANAEEADLIPGSRRSPGEWMATHSSILAWRILWMEDLSGLQSMGSQRVRHDWMTNTFSFRAGPRSQRDFLSRDGCYMRAMWATGLHPKQVPEFEISICGLHCICIIPLTTRNQSNQTSSS